LFEASQRLHFIAVVGPPIAVAKKNAGAAQTPPVLFELASRSRFLYPRNINASLKRQLNYHRLSRSAQFREVCALACSHNMHLLATNSKSESTPKAPVGRSLTLSLVAIALALIYSLFALGSNLIPEFRGCSPAKIVLAGTQGAPVGIGLGIQSVTASSNDSSTAAAAAAAVKAPVQAGQAVDYSYADVGLHSTSIPFKLPAAVGLPSDAWRPHIFSECAAGMPRGYAPCLNYTNLLRAEELVYPGEQ
jgi:hypothetical protein